MDLLSSLTFRDLSSSCPFESPIMETGSLPFGRPSKQSLLPCQVNTLSMLPTKHPCQCFFTSIAPSFHSQVIDLDKAIRLQAANKKHLCPSEFAMFNDLRTIHFSLFDEGPSIKDGEYGSSKHYARPTVPWDGELYNNWNQNLTQMRSSSIW